MPVFRSQSQMPSCAVLCMARILSIALALQQGDRVILGLQGVLRRLVFLVERRQLGVLRIGAPDKPEQLRLEAPEQADAFPDRVQACEKTAERVDVESHAEGRGQFRQPHPPYDGDQRVQAAEEDQEDGIHLDQQKRQDGRRDGDGEDDRLVAVLQEGEQIGGQDKARINDLPDGRGLDANLDNEQGGHEEQHPDEDRRRVAVPDGGLMGGEQLAEDAAKAVDDDKDAGDAERRLCPVLLEVVADRVDQMLHAISCGASVPVLPARHHAYLVVAVAVLDHYPFRTVA